MQERLKILLVEDDEEDYLLVQAFLNQTDVNQYDLVWSPSYKEGLERLGSEYYSAVLVDYFLGQYTGLQFIKEVTSRNSSVPTILLTGNGNTDIDVQVMQAGAVGYLSKNEVTPQLLERSIRYAVEQKRTEQRLRHEAARAKLLSNLSSDFAEAGSDYLGLARTIARRVAEVYQDGIIIRLLAKDGKRLEPAAVYHPDKETQKQMNATLAKIRVQVDKGLVSEVAFSREPRLLCQATGLEELAGVAYQEFSLWFTRNPVEYIYAIPLYSLSQLVGLMAVVRHKPARRISADEQEFYLDLANRAAVAIENARAYHEMEQQALTDTLTGLYNRRGIDQYGRREMKRHQRYRHPLSAIMLDIDTFKSVNDRYGHAFGDEVLKALSGSCTANIRSVDIACRYGGDEFLILLPETDLLTARSIANRIRECFAERTFLSAGQPVHLTASFGVAEATEKADNLDALIEEADTALYVSKIKGRNRVEILQDH